MMWSADQDERLRRIWAKYPIDEIAAALGRTTAAVEYRAGRLGLAPRSDRKPAAEWTDPDIAELRRLVAKGLSASQIGAALGRSRNSIIGKVNRLGLSLGAPPPKNGGRPAGYAWTNERIGLLKQLWDDAGLTLAMIGAQLGVTRGAVYQAGLRLGLPSRAKASLPRPVAPTTGRHGGHDSAAKILQRIHADADAIDLSQRHACFDAREGSISFAELDHGFRKCRWPFGSSRFRFCGCQVVEGKSYCPEHFAMSIGRGTPSERRADELDKRAA